jgi:PKHD-type hydroxylase
MMVILDAVLSAEDVALVRERLAASAWGDGRATAGAAARDVKRNQQARGEDAAALQSFIRRALERHPVFASAARPKRISAILLSRYSPGMAYGRHTDDAVMGAGERRLRTDFAFTLFLAPPESYAGGALRVESLLGVQEIKLEPGQAVLYPAGSIHEVTPVTAGERLAAVGWVESLVPGQAERDVLFRLDQARAQLAAEGASATALLQVDQVASNLMRLWARP